MNANEHNEIKKGRKKSRKKKRKKKKKEKIYVFLRFILLFPFIFYSAWKINNQYKKKKKTVRYVRLVSLI